MQFGLADTFFKTGIRNFSSSIESAKGTKWVKMSLKTTQDFHHGLVTAKDTSQKSKPMQRSWSSRQLRAPVLIESGLTKQGEISPVRYLIIQVPALRVDNQNPVIGLKAGIAMPLWRHAQTTRFHKICLGRGICQGIHKENKQESVRSSIVRTPAVNYLLGHH